MYPEILQPKEFELVRLFDGEEIQIPKAQPQFDKWCGGIIEDTYGGKSILNFGEEPVFAEIAILRIFQSEGWDGVWVDTYRRKYRTGYWKAKGAVELPVDKKILLNGIYELAGSMNGCWDVFCWKEEKIIFAESKRLFKDKIREAQVKWLRAALDYGLKQESFLIVEWSLDTKV